MKGRPLAVLFGCWSCSHEHSRTSCQSESNGAAAKPQDVAATATQGLQGACFSEGNDSGLQSIASGGFGVPDIREDASEGPRDEGLLSPSLADKRPRASMRTSCGASMLLGTISDVAEEELGGEWRPSDEAHVRETGPSCCDSPTFFRQTSSGPLTMHQAQLTGSASTSDNRLTNSSRDPSPSLYNQQGPPNHQLPPPHLPPPAAGHLPTDPSATSGRSTGLTSTSGDPFPSSPFKDASTCPLGAPQLPPAQDPSSWSLVRSLESPRTPLRSPLPHPPFLATSTAPSFQGSTHSATGPHHHHYPQAPHSPTLLSPRNSPHHHPGFASTFPSTNSNVVYVSGSCSGLAGHSPQRSTPSASTRLAASGRLFLLRRSQDPYAPDDLEVESLTSPMPGGLPYSNTTPHHHPASLPRNSSAHAMRPQALQTSGPNVLNSSWDQGAGSPGATCPASLAGSFTRHPSYQQPQPLPQQQQQQPQPVLQYPGMGMSPSLAACAVPPLVAALLPHQHSHNGSSPSATLNGSAAGFVPYSTQPPHSVTVAGTIAAVAAIRGQIDKHVRFSEGTNSPQSPPHSPSISAAQHQPPPAGQLCSNCHCSMPGSAAILETPYGTAGNGPVPLPPFNPPHQQPVMAPPEAVPNPHMRGTSPPHPLHALNRGVFMPERARRNLPSSSSVPGPMFGIPIAGSGVMGLPTTALVGIPEGSPEHGASQPLFARGSFPEATVRSKSRFLNSRSSTQELPEKVNSGTLKSSHSMTLISVPHRDSHQLAAVWAQVTRESAGDASVLPLGGAPVPAAVQGVQAAQVVHALPLGNTLPAVHVHPQHEQYYMSSSLDLPDAPHHLHPSSQLCTSPPVPLVLPCDNPSSSAWMASFPGLDSVLGPSSNSCRHVSDDSTTTPSHSPRLPTTLHLTHLPTLSTSYGQGAHSGGSPPPHIQTPTLHHPPPLTHQTSGLVPSRSASLGQQYQPPRLYHQHSQPQPQQYAQAPGSSLKVRGMSVGTTPTGGVIPSHIMPQRSYSTGQANNPAALPVRRAATGLAACLSSSAARGTYQQSPIRQHYASFSSTGAPGAASMGSNRLMRVGTATSTLAAVAAGGVADQVTPEDHDSVTTSIDVISYVTPGGFQSAGQHLNTGDMSTCQSESQAPEPPAWLLSRNPLRTAGSMAIDTWESGFNPMQSGSYCGATAATGAFTPTATSNYGGSDFLAPVDGHTHRAKGVTSPATRLHSHGRTQSVMGSCEPVMSASLSIASASLATQLQLLPLSSIAAQITGGLVLLGAGAGGAVYRTSWRGAPAAIKFCSSSSLEHLNRAAHEAVLSRAVAHPHLVQTYFTGIVQLAPADFAPPVCPPRRSITLEALMEGDLSGAGALSEKGDNDNDATTTGGSGAAWLAFEVLRSDSFTDIIPSAASAVDPAAAEAAVAKANMPIPTCISGPATGSQGGAQEQGRGSGLAPGGVSAGGAAPSALARGFSGASALKADHLHHSNSATAGRLSALLPANSGGSGVWELPGNKGATLANVLEVLKAQPGDHMTVIVMELCDRGSLSDAIAKGAFSKAGADNGSSPLARGAARGSNPQPGRPAGSPAAPLLSMLGTARDIALGMHHLHLDGIVHGDLKPANVLLRSTRDSRGHIAKVADFGMSRIAAAVAAPGESIHMSECEGTPCYMAPEAMSGLLVYASDVWSFGMLLYHMAAGEAPFTGMHHAQIMYQYQSADAAGQGPPVDWPANTPSMIVRLGNMCLQHEPSRRPSFSAVSKVLELMIERVQRTRRTGHPAGGTSPPAAQPPSPPASAVRAWA